MLAGYPSASRSGSRRPGRAQNSAPTLPTISLSQRYVMDRGRDGIVEWNLSQHAASHSTSWRDTASTGSSAGTMLDGGLARRTTPIGRSLCRSISRRCARRIRCGRRSFTRSLTPSLDPATATAECGRRWRGESVPSRGDSLAATSRRSKPRGRRRAQPGTFTKDSACRRMR